MTYTPAVVTHLVKSQHVHQTFKVQVMLPSQERGEETQFPVVYATDGNFSFDVLKGLSFSMQLEERDAPRFILVGIGYPGDSPMSGAMLRVRDLTFPGYPQFSTEPPRSEDVPMVEEDSKAANGAEDFQRFLAKELFPLIDGTHATRPGERTYFGHSAGGGFGLHTLFNQPQLFTNYIVSSPSLSFHGQSSAGISYEDHDFLIQDARRFLTSGAILKDTKLYMSVGTEEEFETGLEAWQFVSSFYRLGALLRAMPVPGLHVMTEAIAQETHLTVWPIAFMHGIRSVLDVRSRRKSAADIPRL